MENQPKTAHYPTQGSLRSLRFRVTVRKLSAALLEGKDAGVILVSCYPRLG
jgi:hypothetical protein